MTFNKKDAMHAKGKPKTLDIINAITYDTPILPEHFQQLFKLGAI